MATPKLTQAQGFSVGIIEPLAWIGLLVAGIWLAARPRHPLVRVLGWSLIAAWVYATVYEPIGQYAIYWTERVTQDIAGWIGELSRQTAVPHMLQKGA